MTVKTKPQLKIIMAGKQEPKPFKRKNSSTVALMSNPDVMHGALVLGGTRIPVATLLDELIAGSTIDDFVEGHPSIFCGDVQAALHQLREALNDRLLIKRVCDYDNKEWT